jgi:hypothetical protein
MVHYGLQPNSFLRCKDYADASKRAVVIGHLTREAMADGATRLNWPNAEAKPSFRTQIKKFVSADKRRSIHRLYNSYRQNGYSEKGIIEGRVTRNRRLF